VLRDFLDVMHQTVELPLRIDFSPTAQHKAMKPFVVSQVAEHGLNDGEPLAVSRAPLRVVDSSLHSVSC
jgi:hypothetical protein